MRVRGSVTATVGMIAVVGVLAGSCREPTQVTIVATTNVTYRPTIVTAFTVGSGAVEVAEPSTESRAAWGPDGAVGTLVSVPRGDRDAALAVKVVMGIARDPRDCLAANYAGCIVARRRLRYVPHERLTLPVPLYARCEGVPCDADTTCNALGTCVSIDVDPSRCSPEGCGLPGDVDAGDGGSESGAPIDGAAGPDAFAPDGAIEGGRDAGIGEDGDPTTILCDGKGGPILCPRPGTACCAGTPSLAPACTASGCQGSQTFLLCDGPEDCLLGQRCCYVGSTAACSAACGNYRELCHGNSQCAPGTACSGIFDAYRYCQ